VYSSELEAVDDNDVGLPAAMLRLLYQLLQILECVRFVNPQNTVENEPLILVCR
jgi:hypothetical protein